MVFGLPPLSIVTRLLSPSAVSIQHEEMRGQCRSRAFKHAASHWNGLGCLEGLASFDVGDPGYLQLGTHSKQKTLSQLNSWSRNRPAQPQG